jgi:hypothetical protein
MWVKVDDGMHAHRKTRAVTKSHTSKVRDAGPMGLWLLAASWAGQNATDGWVPEDELDRWDDDWHALTKRLVASGYWWPQERNGERGYGFNDWHDYNDPTDAASKAGTYGNHIRWHVNEAKVDPACQHCPKEPDEPEDRGDIGGRSGGDSQPESGGESRNVSGAIALPEPDPTRTRPEPEPRKRPAIRLPDDWQPTPSHWERRHDGIDVQREADTFRAHAEANDRRVVNWNAAFTQWLLKAKPSPASQPHKGRAAQWLDLTRQLGEPTTPQIGEGR